MCRSGVRQQLAQVPQWLHARPLCASKGGNEHGGICVQSAGTGEPPLSTCRGLCCQRQPTPVVRPLPQSHVRQRERIHPHICLRVLPPACLAPPARGALLSKTCAEQSRVDGHKLLPVSGAVAAGAIDRGRRDWVERTGEGRRADERIAAHGPLLSPDCQCRRVRAFGRTRGRLRGMECGRVVKGPDVTAVTAV
jgi:hypothetical protein